MTCANLESERQTGNSITSLQVANQVGASKIDTDKKEIIVVIEDNGANISSIEIKALDLSYAAIADKTVGQKLRDTLAKVFNLSPFLQAL